MIYPNLDQETPDIGCPLSGRAEERRFVMRYTPFPRPVQRPITARRLAHAEHALAQERERWGLFAAQMVTETASERVERLDRSVQDAQAWLRRHVAAQWRTGRRALFALPPCRRRHLLAAWNAQQWLPGSAEYFLDFLRRHGVALP